MHGIKDENFFLEGFDNFLLNEVKTYYYLSILLF